MFIAHLPAGFLLTAWLQKKIGHRSRRLMAVGLVASLLPDIDLVRFYFVDHGRFHHHMYFTHLPLFWMVLGLGAYALAALMGKRNFFPYILMVTANVLLHMLMDTPVGSIRWFYPFSEGVFPFFSVSKRYDWWVWNFILHWTFLVEILIIVASLVVLVRLCRKPSSLPMTTRTSGK